ncbi:MAG: SDR family oxidoreductase [Pirellulales bacterium]|nr:SDR family oxidoreductase [Pirellulales bacterium]
MANRTLELDGRWALVTGSTSGIGEAIAKELALAGANLIVHGFQKRAAAARLTETLSQNACEARMLLADLSLAEERTRLVEQAWQIAPIDIWINNAGADVLTGAASQGSFAEKLKRLWEVDVAATLHLSRAVGAQMKQRGQGVLLNMGWDQATTGMAGDSGQMFAAIKGAIMAFSSSLAKSLAPEVRVNCLAPGWIKTAWGETASAEWQGRAVQESLVARWGTPEDVAQAACYLASPRASFITGQIFCVNGGSSR